MSQSELKELLKNNERYRDFHIFKNPAKFNEKFAGKDADVVQLHSIQTYGDNKDICGFCGQCSWKNGVLTPLDGDTYSENMTVYGYKWWNDEKEGIKWGLDILVGTDW